MATPSISGSPADCPLCPTATDGVCGLHDPTFLARFSEADDDDRRGLRPAWAGADTTNVLGALRDA